MERGSTVNWEEDDDLDYQEGYEEGYWEGCQDRRGRDCGGRRRPGDRRDGSRGPSGSAGGCYVATCVYGSYDCPEVWTLRRFRDERLARHLPGRVFIRIYYALSPAVVRHFGGAAGFRRFWRGRLDALVRRLRAQGVADTPYCDRPR